MSTAYPFTALVGVDDLRLALLLNAVDPGIGGVLVRGEKGTAKSTAVRGLARLLPPVQVVEGDPFRRDPADPSAPDGPVVDLPVSIVELPVGASEDRVTGSLDLQRALTTGETAFEPGLLAAAHRGILYVDEVNLLGDHLVDLLLDAAAMGVNRVEREGVSIEHAARFQLIGTMNPEEGELRPQLLDRFGLSVDVRASRERTERVEVVRRRLSFDDDPEGFATRFAADDDLLAERVRRARALLPDVVLGEAMLDAVVAACTTFDVDGMRADLVTARTARTVAAWEGRTEVVLADVRAAARLALPHRRRRGPFEDPGLDEDELDRALADHQPPDDEGDDRPDDGPDDPPDGDGGPGGGVPPSADDQRRPPPGHGDGGGPPAVPSDGPPQPGRQDEAASADPAPADGRQGAQLTNGVVPEQVLGVGQTFAPVLLRLDGRGGGAWGRRSPAASDRGRRASVRRSDSGRTDGGRQADLALVPTLRAAAPHQQVRGRIGPGLRLQAQDLRTAVREGREGNLVLFLVDASGSMAARQRMVAVKGAVTSLLLDAYQRRDKVGLITFRGDDAHVALPPTGSVELAVRRLGDLPTGGRTPLAAGLEAAGHVIAAQRVRDPRRRPLLLVLTDGRATSPRGSDPVGQAMMAARGLATRGVAALVVDTEDAPVRLGLAGTLAAAIGAPWVRLEDLAAGSLAGLVRTVTRAA